MDIAALALIITTVTGAVVAVMTLVFNRKASIITTRVDDTGVAFNALNTTVETLNKENKRVREELETVRGEYSKCEEARKEFSKIVGQQATKISTLNTAVEELSSKVQEMHTRLS